MRPIYALLLVIVLSAQATSAFAQDNQNNDHPMRIDQNNKSDVDTRSAINRSNTTEIKTHEVYGYREVSDFFNIREANSQVDKGEWEVEFQGGWSTYSNHHDDNFGLEETIKYGFTDDFFVELEVMEPNLGDGANQGNGDLNLLLFNRFVRETDCLPAIGGQAEMRIPTGDGSSGVDGTFSLIATKTFCEKFRVHFQGFVETANGDPGGDDVDRRHFQWGVGPGFDYQVCDNLMALINYLNRSSDEYGHHNMNILELGTIYEICHTECTHQHIKLAIDIGLDGAGETENFGAKFQYSIDWK